MEVKNEKSHRRNGGQYKESDIAHVIVNMSDSYYVPVQLAVSCVPTVYLVKT